MSRVKELKVWKSLGNFSKALVCVHEQVEACKEIWAAKHIQQPKWDRQWGAQDSTICEAVPRLRPLCLPTAGHLMVRMQKSLEQNRREWTRGTHWALCHLSVTFQRYLTAIFSALQITSKLFFWSTLIWSHTSRRILGKVLLPLVTMTTEQTRIAQILLALRASIISSSLMF